MIPWTSTSPFNILIGHLEVSKDTQSHGLEFYVVSNSFSSETEELFGYISWLDIWLYRILFNVKKANFTNKCAILFHTLIIAIKLQSKNFTEKILLPSVVYWSGPGFSSFIMSPWRLQNHFILCASDFWGPITIPSDFWGPFLPQWGSRPPQSSVTLPLHPLTSTNSFCVLPNMQESLWDMIFEYLANGYPFYFNLKASQLSDLYLWVHFLILPTVTYSLKSSFGTCGFPEISYFFFFFFFWESHIFIAHHRIFL